jgi:hypothetical protein
MTIYGRLPRKAICWRRRLECTNLSGLLRDDCAPLALMGVRGFWPHNMIGLEGLVVNQAWKLRSLPTNHQVSPRIRDGLRFSADARRSCGG